MMMLNYRLHHVNPFIHLHLKLDLKLTKNAFRCEV